MATDTSTLTPVEIDTELAANYYEQAKLQAQIAATVRYLERDEARLVRNDTPGNRHQVEQDRERLAELQEKRGALIAASTPYQVEYRSRPWNRYYLVDNTNGHVHRGMNCVTCFSTTVYNWLVDLADCDEDAMIEEWGERACTVCFPEAPVNPNYHRPARRDREAQEARAAEAAARNAAKAEKAITDVDGSVLKDAHGYPLKTKVAARNELSGAIESVAYGYGEEYVNLVRRLVPALEAAGVDWRKAAANKLAKVRKEQAKPNPWAHALTAEQVADQAAKSAAGLAAAEALLQEVSG